MSFSDELTMREKLREPFPKEQIGKLPRTDKRPALDYVGHAAVTDRLNRYAPDWTYTVDKLFDHGNVTYIEGTMIVGGVPRVEYGDGKSPKEALGNFIRRGAMRFGVALDLWSREELDSSVGAVQRPASAETSSEAPLAGTKAEGAADSKPPVLSPSVASESSAVHAAEPGAVSPSNAGEGGSPSSDSHRINPKDCKHPKTKPSPVARMAEKGWTVCEVCDLALPLVEVSA